MDDLYQKYLESAVHFLSYRARSEKEVRYNLEKKLAKGQSSLGRKESEEMIDRVVSWLREQRFLNDADFAKQWVESRARSKPKSLQLIKMELRQKGVAQDIIDQVVSDPETQVGSDKERARKIALKKFPKYQHLTKQEIYQKLCGVLARNGFDWEIIKESIDALIAEQE